jgi:multiple sugar transport system permease protein
MLGPPVLPKIQHLTPNTFVEEGTTQATRVMPSRRWRFGWRERRALAGLLFVLPTWLVWVFWTAGPALSTIAISFSNWNLLGMPTLAGASNYVKLVSDPLFLLSFRNSLVYTLIFTPTGILLALTLAILIDGTTKLREYYRVAYFLPVVTSVAASAILWKWLYQPSFGLINTLLDLVGIAGPSWLNDRNTALLAIGIMGVWQGLGFTITIFLAGLQSIPPSLYEAARIDGATKLQQVFRITVPLLRGTALFVSVIGVADAFQVFSQVFIMTKGGPAYASSTLAYYLYVSAIQRFQMGYGAAIAVVIFTIVLLVTLAQLKIFRQSEVDY